MGFINQHLYHWGARIPVWTIMEIYELPWWMFMGFSMWLLKKEDTGNSFHGLEDPII